VPFYTTDYKKAWDWLSCWVGLGIGLLPLYLHMRLIGWEGERSGSIGGLDRCREVSKAKVGKYRVIALGKVASNSLITEWAVQRLTSQAMSQSSLEMASTKEDAEDEFYTPRPSIDFRVSLENRPSSEDLLSCHDSIIPTHPAIPFSVASPGYNTSSTNYQSEAPGIPEASFKIRNILTGEVIDLRDENESGFGNRLADFLTLRDGVELEHHL